MAHVFINETKVATYIRTDAGGSSLSYDTAVHPANAVCATMPPRPPPYTATPAPLRPDTLLPFFALSLPEGAFRQRLNEIFAKQLPAYDSMTLLEIVGHSIIGRVRVLNETAIATTPPPAINIAELMERKGGQEVFADLFNRFANSAGVSGAQPKLLVQDKITASKLDTRITLKDATHILKAFDAREYPHLASNEYLCLLAAKEAKIPTAGTSISLDGSLLAVKRFDIRQDGSFLGFEDTCSLKNLYPAQKYTGSYEQVAHALEGFLSASPDFLSDMRNFFKSFVLSCVVRNGDAHRKNFGVLYEHPTGTHPNLAPAYDIITSTCYLPGDKLALTLDGSTNWPTTKKLTNFGINFCRLSRQEATAAIEEVGDAVAAIQDNTKKGKIQLPDAAFDFINAEVLPKWEEGLNAISPNTTNISQPSQIPAKAQQRAMHI
jgi:serine/threonine-protein kinase HipA